MRFDEFVEAALYDPDHGFYTTVGSAGRRGDFITSPEAGPLFGAVIANALDSWWRELGEPDPFTVIEVGAGVGTLARSVAAATPACSGALFYLMVERSDRLRAMHGEHMEVRYVEPASDADADADADAPQLDDLTAGGGNFGGPVFISLAEVPEGGLVGVVLANELLDNLAFRLLERREDGWDELFVSDELSVSYGGGTNTSEEVLREAPADVAALADQLTPAAPEGARLAIQEQARLWVQDMTSRIRYGRLVVIDYATTSTDMVDRHWLQWVRTYKGHGSGGSVFEEPGSRDITCEVAVDQLSLDVEPISHRSQADFLRAHGIAELVDEGRRIWAERAHIGDLTALKARSRIVEAEALCDPSGLGAFRVLEWRTP